jgi:hypothetical protein
MYKFLATVSLSSPTVMVCNMPIYALVSEEDLLEILKTCLNIILLNFVSVHVKQHNRFPRTSLKLFLLYLFHNHSFG